MKCEAVKLQSAEAGLMPTFCLPAASFTLRASRCPAISLDDRAERMNEFWRAVSVPRRARRWLCAAK